MGLKNDFSLLPAPVIQDMLNAAIEQFKAAMQLQDSTISGRRVQRANLADLAQNIADLSRAYAVKTGQLLPNAVVQIILPYLGGNQTQGWNSAPDQVDIPV